LGRLRLAHPGDEKAVHGALIRHGTMLSTSVNPTDGPRFDGGTPFSAEGDVHPQEILSRPKGR
jgi:hypothetical protein